MNPHSLSIISAALVIAIVVGLVIDPTWNRYWEIVHSDACRGDRGNADNATVAMVVEVKPCEKPPSSPCSHSAWRAAVGKYRTRTSSRWRREASSWRSRRPL